jgi:uncharacterized protein (DUF488 family)
VNNFYTIGHSTRTLDEFAGLLKSSGVTELVDVRTVPRSRINPQFNTDSLPQSLRPLGIGYRHIAELGGLRGRRKDRPESPNLFWDNASFRNYADYAGTAPFREGLHTLRQMGQSQTCAVMCAEALWWRCHRRIIADYLIAAGETVFHILGAKKVEPAHLTPAAQSLPDGTLLYAKPAEAQKDLFSRPSSRERRRKGSTGRPGSPGRCGTSPSARHRGRAEDPWRLSRP